jgi:hypothetical protein
MQTAQTVAASDDISFDDLEALLALGLEEDEEVVAMDEDFIDADDLLASDLQDDVAQEVVEEEVKEEDLDLSAITSAIKRIESQELANEIYAEQESSDDHIEIGEKTVEEKEIKAKAVKKASTPRATTFTHSRGELVAERANPDFFMLEQADKALDEAGQLVKHEEVLNLIKSMNVKGGAKCLNLLSASSGKAKLSVFIDCGIHYILGDNVITKADLEAYFMSAARNKAKKAYNKTTAMPQALTLLKLFTDLKMINRVGATYEINPESVLIESFSKAYKGA